MLNNESDMYVLFHSYWYRGTYSLSLYTDEDVFASWASNSGYLTYELVKVRSDSCEGSANEALFSLPCVQSSKMAMPNLLKWRHKTPHWPN